jgi:hypothetical protein
VELHSEQIFRKIHISQAANSSRNCSAANRNSESNSAKIFHVQAAAFDDAFHRSDGNGFAAVHGHDHLPPILVSPFLMAAGLCNQHKAVLAQNLDDFLGVADWKPSAHGMASSISFAPLFILTGAGSNQSSNASFALAMASASVSPAEAQPGSSGNTADQRFVSESNSTRRRSFIPTIWL